MAKIILETEAASIGGGSGAIDKKCCTAYRAYELGCNVNGNYQPNQLIPEGSISARKQTLHVNVKGKAYLNTSGSSTTDMKSTFFITIGIDARDVTIYADLIYGDGNDVGEYTWVIEPSDWTVSTDGINIYDKQVTVPYHATTEKHNYLCYLTSAYISDPGNKYNYDVTVQQY